MTYPELLRLWEIGGPNGTGFIKSSRKQFQFRIEDYLTDDQLMKDFKEWSVKSHTKNAPTSALLNAYGRFLRDNYKELFGIRAMPFMPSDTPLYETGDLQSKTAYKTSKGKRVTTK
jgi:hypothetical protein